MCLSVCVCPYAYAHVCVCVCVCVCEEVSMGPVAAFYLSSGLVHVPVLKTLHLNRNPLGVEGARYLSEGLKHVPLLEDLLLSGMLLRGSVLS
jgi:hypothetical protein